MVGGWYSKYSLLEPSTTSMEAAPKNGWLREFFDTVLFGIHICPHHLTQHTKRNTCRWSRKSVDGMRWHAIAIRGSSRRRCCRRGRCSHSTLNSSNLGRSSSQQSQPKAPEAAQSNGSCCRCSHHGHWRNDWVARNATLNRRIGALCSGGGGVDISQLFPADTGNTHTHR